jgi:hypothetical protein
MDFCIYAFGFYVHRIPHDPTTDLLRILGVIDSLECGVYSVFETASLCKRGGNES